MPNGDSQPIARRPVAPQGIPVFRERLAKIKRLPERLRETLFADETAEKLGRIVAAANLSGQHGIISRAVGEVLMGTLSPNFFIATLAQRLDMEKEKVREVAMEISKQIFQPVREELIALYHLQPAPQPPAPAAQSPTQKPPPTPPVAEPQESPPPPHATPQERLPPQERLFPQENR